MNPSWVLFCLGWSLMGTGLLRLGLMSQSYILVLSFLGAVVAYGFFWR
jgi:hypothetical protein